MYTSRVLAMCGYNDRWCMLWYCTCAQDNNGHWMPYGGSEHARQTRKHANVVRISVEGHPFLGSSKVEHAQRGRVVVRLVVAEVLR